MGTILSTQGRTSLHDWDPNEKTSAEDLDDSMDWLRRSPIRNRFDTGNRGVGNRTTENGDTLPSRAARSSDLDRVGLRSGNGVSSSIRRPGKYFLGDEEDEIDLPRRERINFKLLAAQLFRPKRAMVSVAPRTSDPNVYAFSSPLSEELACLDLVTLSRDRRDWRTVTEARPKDPMEERILDRLLHIKRLEDETVEMENAERSSRGSQCRAYEQQQRQTRTSASGGKDFGLAGRSDVRVARALETKVYRLGLPMERSGLEKSTRLRKIELKDDPTGKPQSQKRCTSRKPQLERPDDTSEQSVSRLILASSIIQPGCEKLVQVKGHQLISDDPDDMKTKLEGSSSLKLRAGHRKLGNGRLAAAASFKTHPSLRSVSFADPPKMPRSTKQKTSSSSAASSASATAKPSSSKKRLQSSKKRPRTAV